MAKPQIEVGGDLTGDLLAPLPGSRTPQPFLPDGSPATWYEATATRPPITPALADAITADVCVVGAGLTGLSAALELASRGYRTVILEARLVGWGASGRNGGQIVHGFNRDMMDIERAVGEADARLLWDLALEAKRHLDGTVRTHGIDCALTWGLIAAAVKPRQVRQIADWLAEWQDRYGYDQLTVLDAEEMRRRVASGRYLAGVHDGGGGHLHTLNFALGLAHAAAEAGAQLYETSAVTAVDFGTKVTLRTRAGSVTADFAVLARNAYLERLVPHLPGMMVPASTYVAVTEPLGEDRAQSLIPGNEAVYDMNHILDYFRRTEDHRLLFGGGVSYAAAGRADTMDFLRQRVLTVFPQLDGVQMEFGWEGKVALTKNRLPHLGRLAPNLYFAHGYSGHGVALAGFAGRLMADAIAGTAERFDVFARIPHSQFPGGDRLRRPLLALAMLWYRLMDRLG